MEGALVAEECLRAGGFGLVLLRMLLAREVLLRTLSFILPRVLCVREVLLRELVFILPRVPLVLAVPVVELLFFLEGGFPFLEFKLEFVFAAGFLFGVGSETGEDAALDAGAFCILAVTLVLFDDACFCIFCVLVPALAIDSLRVLVAFVWLL